MSDHSEIRLLAHLIWECEGCPTGREARHWNLAVKLAEAAALAPDRAYVFSQRGNEKPLAGQDRHSSFEKSPDVLSDRRTH